MSDGWKTSISVGIDDTCPMEFRVQSGGVVEFLTAHDAEEFDMSFEFNAFRRFIELGGSAVAKAEAQIAAEQATSDGLKRHGVGPTSRSNTQD